MGGAHAVQYQEDQSSDLPRDKHTQLAVSIYMIFWICKLPH